MRKMVSLFLLVLLICGFMVISNADSTNPNKALPALTAKVIKDLWQEIEYNYPGQYTKGEIQSTIVSALNESKHEFGYEKEPYNESQALEVVVHIGLGLGDSDD